MTRCSRCHDSLVQADRGFWSHRDRERNYDHLPTPEYIMPEAAARER